MTAAGTETAGFVPVELPSDGTASTGFEQPAASGASDPVIEIGLAGGRSLKVPSSLPASDLRRLTPRVEGA